MAGGEAAQQASNTELALTQVRGLPFFHLTAPHVLVGVPHFKLSCLRVSVRKEEQCECVFGVQ